MSARTAIPRSTPGLIDLYALFCELFQDALALRRFVRLLPRGRALTRALPAGGSLDAFALETATLLDRQGRIDESLFRALAAVRPERADEIDAVRAVYLEPPPESVHDGSPRTRRDPAMCALEAASLPYLDWFFGRDVLADELAAKLAQDQVAPVAILGPGGIGKSTLAAAALHRREVVARYGANRYFVRLDGAPTATAVLDRVGCALGMAVGAVTLKDVVATLAGGPALLILDGLDQPWEQDTRATEAILTQVGNTRDTALVVTMRGATRPAGLPWAPPIELAPLSHEAARRLFCAVANLAGQRAEDPTVDVLVGALDGIPLAVKLLAHQAEGAVLGHIEAEWRRKRLALLNRSCAVPDRLSSWEVSVELSWDSPCVTDDARRLASLLALLPDGGAIDDAPALLPASGHAAMRVLAQVSLASYTEGERMRMLAPVREYLEATYPPAEDDLVRVMEHYRSLALELGPRGGRAGGAGAVVRLAPEVANLDAMIRRGLAGADPAPWIDAAVALTRFARFSGLSSPSPLAPALAAATKLGDLRRQARCEASLGEIALYRGAYDQARAHFEAAVPRFEAVDEVAGRAHCIKGLGHIALRRGDYDAARPRYQEARTLYQRAGEVIGRANCIFSLGMLALRCSEPHEARARYEEARALYEEAGDPLGEAHGIMSLGHLELKNGALERARERYREALPLFEQVASLRGRAGCIVSLGHIAFKRARLGEAEALYGEAKALYEQTGDLRGLADCWAGLGEVALERTDLDGACARWEQALVLYRRISAPHLVERTERRLARLVKDESAYARCLETARHAWGSISHGDLIAPCRPPVYREHGA